MPTEKLYWGDSHAARFSASSFRLARFAGGAPSVVLERSLFFPEGGGQLGDHGELAVALKSSEVRLTILDTQIDDATEEIHHLLDEASAARLGEALASLGSNVQDAHIEAEVNGVIDAARRADHRAHHTAQHMVSRALVDVAQADTVSARLGAGACTIDVDVAALRDADLARVEDLVNGVVRDDVAVRASFPTAEELARLPLRRAPKVASGIRVIEVEGFDVTPCGGTHATRSGQIGLIRVTSVERFKGKMRVYFQAAERALATTRARDEALLSLARDFTCGPLDVAAAVAKLRAEVKARMDALGHARGELVALLADRALAEAPPRYDGAAQVVILAPRGFDVPTLRALAGRLARRDDVIALCVSSERDGDDLSVVLQRGARAHVDCGAWLKRETAARGGRGGGSKERAEGRLSAGTPVGELAKSFGIPEPVGAPSSAADAAASGADGKRPGDG